MKSFRTWLVIAWSFICVAACSSGEQPAPNSNSGAPASSVVPASSPANPVANPTPAASPDAAADAKPEPAKSKSENEPGRERANPKVDAAALFNSEQCAFCHGADGKGKMKGTPDFTDAAWQKKESDADFIKTIKIGKKPMPAFGNKLNDEQIKALVAYVRTFAKKK